MMAEQLSSPAQVSFLAQVSQHRLCCQPPALQRAVQGGGGTVVAANVQAAAEAHGAGQVGGRRLLQVRLEGGRAGWQGSQREAQRHEGWTRAWLRTMYR